jgi:predicted nuclease of predicted toxin-antitoxin system
MQFLIDADLPRSIVVLLQRYGHTGVDVRDIGLGSAPDVHIARYAQTQSLCLLSGDFDFADLRAYPPDRYAGLVILHVPPTATARMILALMEEFLQQDHVVKRLPGHLAIVEFGRVRMRGPLPQP